MTQKLSDILCLASDGEEETLLLHTVSVESQQAASLQNGGFQLQEISYLLPLGKWLQDQSQGWTWLWCWDHT